MNVNIRKRFIIFGALAVGMFVVLFIQLIQLTLVKGEKYAADSGALTQREIIISGARGCILDQNGLPLAYDEKSYNVQFYRDPTQNTSTDRAYYTQIIIETIEIVEANSGETVDTFAIKYDEETGEYYFDWGDISEEAQVLREENWRSNMYVDTESSPEEIYLYLRNKYQIPSEMDYEQARKVLSVWQDVQLASWVAYEPVDVAYDVSIQTVSEIETHSVELKGMSISESTVRIYPRVSVAAHIIGYLGNITDEQELKDYQALGYSVDDLIGITGIEAAMEEYLTGNSSERQGVQEVEIDNMAVVQNVLSSTEPTQGDNVMLTLDIALQLAVEDSLEENIAAIRAEEERLYALDEYGYYEGIDLEDIDLAESGAAVVLDVQTGDILAMASYPSFDLNLFTGGISDEDYDALLNDTATPLFNKAIGSKATPGSIFKMVTGLAALMEGATDPDKGTTLTEQISCGGTFDKYTLYGKSPHCWVKNILNHQNQTIVEGLTHSCNYYFFTLADRLGIDLLDKWGEKFGLTSSTGIEIPGEVIGQIGNQQVLYDNTKPINEQSSYIPQLVKNGENGIVTLLKSIAEAREVEYTDTQIDETADGLIYLAGLEWEKGEDKVWRDVDGTTMGERVRDILYEKLGISKKESRAQGYASDISSMLTELIWTPIDTINTGIGQGIVQVT
ncbi:MAG: penicillin-binding transpeptidase domain-containing protein, partial [Eubacteriales bacterium]|nr:penicillin-binding transpeptidase domain-containing protein [Eubacteriales bacterium]